MAHVKMPDQRPVGHVEELTSNFEVLPAFWRGAVDLTMSQVA